MRFSFRHGLPLLLFLFAGIRQGHAQGGPPFITDDPGTPGNRRWEINLGWTDQRTPGSSEFGVPLLDANYGLGDRIELTYESPWSIFRESGESARAGAGDSLFGCKWRYYDAGDKGWQASVYPQLTFLDPGSHSDRRGLAGGATTLLVPFEVSRDLGPIAVNFDCGHIFSNQAGSRGWMGGLIVGREVRKGLEFDAEMHAETSEGFDRSEAIINAGSRIDLSQHVTLMLALGRDLRETLQPRISLLSYVGIQLRL